MEQLGTYLRNTRESKGIRLEEIASITKINLHSLQLVEDGRWKDLPPEPFIRGFLVAYAKYVGVDSQEVILKYREETDPPGTELTTQTGESPTGSVPQNRLAAIPSPDPSPADLISNPRTVSFKPFAIGAAVLGLVVVVSIIISVGKNSANSPTPVAANPAAAPDKLVELAKESETAPADNRQLASEAKPEAKVETPVAPVVAPAPAPVTAGHTLEVTAKDRTWTKIVIDEAPPVELYLSPGEKVSYHSEKKIKLVLGNSTGAVVNHNGQTVPGKVFQGTIRFYIFPSDARFPQDSAAKRAVATPEPEGETHQAKPIEE